MVFNYNELVVLASTYTSSVIDANLARQLLRLLRKQHFSSIRKAAVAAKLDASTVAKMENLKTWPNYDPGIGVVLKLLTATKTSLLEFAGELASMDEAFELTKATKELRNESLQFSVQPTENHKAPAEQVPSDAQSPPVASTVLESHEAELLRAIENERIRSVVAEELDRRDRERKTTARARKKPQDRSKNRGNARRRA